MNVPKFDGRYYLIISSVIQFNDSHVIYNMLKFRQLNMTHEESYYLTGKKYLFSINISKYDQQENDRNGSEFDEKNIVNTLKERFRNYRTLKFLQLKKL